MRSSVFARWVRSHKPQAFLVLPGILGLVLMGMYFSGSAMLQQVVAPTFYGVSVVSATKVGALELIQAFLLLCVLFFAVRCLMASRNALSSLIAVAIIGAAGFVLLQEIDYGAHYQAVFDRPPEPVRVSEWDPIAREAPPEAELLANRINLILSGVALALLMLAPFFPQGRNRTLRLVVPNGWLTAGAVLAALLFWLAWHLETTGLSVIEGLPGPLSHDRVEWLQLGVYYYLLLFLTGLHERLIARL